MKWYVAALFRRGEHVRPGHEDQRVVQGPFKSDERRDRAMKRFVRDNHEDYLVIPIPIDVQGDEETTIEVGELANVRH